MLNKILFLPGLVILLIISTASFGQTGYQDVVYLKNGSIIRGMIIEQIPNKSIKIETSDRNVFVYQLEEVEKITKEPIANRISDNDGAIVELYENGYQGIVDLGYGIAVGNFGLDVIKLNFINGYRVSQNFDIGFGIGLRHYSKLDAFMIPLFTDLRANFTTSEVAPYMAIDLGYTLNASNDFNGVGLYFSPSIGAMFKTSEKTALNFSVGYEMQKMKVYYYSFNHGYGYTYPQVFSANQSIGSLSLNLGITY